MEPVAFHFLRPGWLLALFPAGWLWWRLWRDDAGGHDLGRYFDSTLLAHLWLEPPGPAAKAPRLLLAIGWLLAIVALAGPSWERAPANSVQIVPGRVLVLDLSPSMNATDLTPSRIARARFKIIDWLKHNPEGDTALVVFAGEPHIAAPLTSDNATLANLLDGLSPAIMPTTGDRAAGALRLAGALLAQAGYPEGEVLLLTDGFDDQASSLQAAKRLAATGHRLSVLGIGSPTGAPVPLADGRLGKIARLDDAMLRTLARQGGGTYHRITPTTEDIAALRRSPSFNDPFSEETVSHSLQQWIDKGVWLLPPLLLLAAVGYRRGWLGSVVLPLVLLPPPADAGWWLTPDQQGERLLRRGDPAAAARHFERKDWRAVALHRAGDHAAAARLWQTLPGPTARYNQGNALARAGRYRDAIAAYEAALALEPGHADAVANKALLERLLQQAPPNQRRETRKTDDGASGTSSSRAPNPDSVQPDGQGSDSGKTSAQGRSDPQPPQQGAAARPSGKDTATAPTGSGGDNAPPPEPSYRDDLALEQWLRQIPDDPAELLQRKFMLEHLLRGRHQ